MIVYSSACVVSKQEGLIERDSNRDLQKHINFIITSMAESNNVAQYTAPSESTEVINLCKASLEAFQKKDTKTIDRNCRIVAQRFSAKETASQEKVEKMGIEIKNGFMVQAILKTDNCYSYLISKMDSLDYLDEFEVQYRRGIEVNKKRLGKSCLITYSTDGTLSINKIEILLDNKAVYFHRDFLELVPVYSDESNTELMMQSILSILEKRLKKTYPKEHLELRNAFIHYARTNDLISYDDMRGHVFEDYFSKTDTDIDNKIVNTIKSDLAVLPENKKFSRQFNIVRDKIKVRKIKYQYKLNDFFELTVKEYRENEIFTTIISGQESDSGKGFVKIYTEDEEALRTFEPKS